MNDVLNLNGRNFNMSYYKRCKKQRLKYKNRYHKYLRGPEWGLVKARIYKARGRTCERCGSSSRLQIHHLHYRNIFKERDEDLEILCNYCHEQEHNI